MTPDLLDDVAESLIDAGVDAATVDRAILAARQQWGGAPVYIKRIDRARRDALIRNALAAGATQSAAAKSVGCGINTVKRLRR